MLATILVVVMILLQTGALSLGLMVDRRFITAAVRLNRKSSSLTIDNPGTALKAPVSETGGVLYAFSSTRSGLDRNWCSSRDGQSLYTDGRSY